MKANEHAIAYLTARYHAQRLVFYFPLKTYIGANLKYVLRNMKHGFHKCNQEYCSIRWEDAV